MGLQPREFPNSQSGASAPEIPDAAERAQALDTTQSWIVEAPAGSGKTGLLIQRYLKLLTTENVTDPAQVLAITFTRKATAEMQERILSQLTAAQSGEPPTKAFDMETRPLALAVLARDAQFGWNLFDSPRCMRIRTIDSVSAEIARGLPVLSGAGGNLSPSDDAGTLHAEAAHRTLMQLGGPDAALSQALVDLLLHRDGNLADAQSLLAAMLATRDQWGELVPLTPHHLAEEYLDSTILPKLEKALEQAICRALTRLTQVMPPATMRTLCALSAEMGHLEGYEGNESPIALCAGNHMPPEESTAHLEHWLALVHLLLKGDDDFRSPTPSGLNKKTLAFQIEKHHRADLIGILHDLAGNDPVHEALCAIRSLPPARYPPEQWRITKSLFRVLSRALVELQLVFAERGECDFAELGLLARGALSRETALDDLRTAAGMSLQHLLVDELQDTSTAQYELIQLLTQHWDGRGQTLFLVGDPKQSIYLFRQANVERFVYTQHTKRLGDVPLGTLHLTANFRSQRSLVEAFNQDFSQIFPPPPTASPTNPGAPGLASETWEEPPPDPTGCPMLSPATSGQRGDNPSPPQITEVPYRPAQPMRPASSSDARVWHAEALPCLDTPELKSTLRTTTSRAHADLIRQITQTYAGKSIAVLVRNKNHLLDIVKAFKAAQIPYRAVDIEPLAERQEVLDLLTLTRALLHPADRTAWLALLRAPWCGLTLPDLHQLTGQDDPAFAKANLVDLIQQRGDLISDDGIARLEPLWSVMAAALAQRSQLPLTQLVERTWRAFAADQVLSPEALTNTTSYFELLHVLEQQPGPLDLEKLNQRLEKLFAAAGTHPGAVDLLTIHKAKGLEWDVVFVPALERTSGRDSGSLLSWLEIDPGQGEDVAHGILAPIQARGAETSRLFAWMRGIQSARQAAERKRLFYVACTRAREELHLFAAPMLSSKGELKPKTDSLLHAAWPAAEPHIQIPAPNLVTMPSPGVVDTLAAGALLHFPAPTGLAAPVLPAPRVVERIPLALLQIAPPQPQVQAPSISRPQGNYAARAFGNAMHDFLELAAKRLDAGQSPASLAAELPGWSPRLAAVLRASGLGPQSLKQYVAALARGLENTLTDPAGSWLLLPHPEARSESSLTSPDATLRLDRTFLAGPTPGSSASTHLWIVDYKTATHAQTGVEAFLTEQKALYQPKLEAYAEASAHRGLPIRLALYYPMLPHLIWWPHKEQ